MSGTTGPGANPLSPMPGGEPVNMPRQDTDPSLGPAPGPRPAPMPTSFAEARKTLEDFHGQAKAQFEATGKSLAKIDLIRKSLDKLAEKGDVVTTEDIVEEAGKLASRGIEPMGLAGILADMPQEGGGEALAGWLAGHAQVAEQGEKNLLMAHQQAGHQLASSALHLLRAHAVSQALISRQAPDSGLGSNPLAAGGGLP